MRNLKKPKPRIVDLSKKEPSHDTRARLLLLTDVGSHGEPARGLPGFAANSSPSGNVGVTKECGQPANAEALDQDSTSPGAPNDMTEDVKPNGNSNKYEEANTLEDCYPIIEFEDFWNEEADLVNNRTESDSDHASHISNYGTSPESCGAQNDTEYGIDTEINEFFGGACTTEDEAREEAGSTVSERYEVNMPYKECAVETKATSRMTIQFESGLLKSPEKTLIVILTLPPKYRARLAQLDSMDKDSP